MAPPTPRRQKNRLLLAPNGSKHQAVRNGRQRPPAEPTGPFTIMQSMRWFAGQPYLILTLTSILWAGNAVAGRFATGHVSPFLLTSLRWAIALAILLPFSVAVLRRDWAAIRTHWRILAFYGVVGFTLFNNLLYLALNYTTAINAAIEQAAMPLFVFVANFILFGIRVTVLQVLGFVLTLVGVVLTATHGNPFGLAQTPLNIGDAIMLAAVAAYGIYSVALARKPQIHWLSLMTATACFAFAASIPFAVAEWLAGRLILPDAQGWIVSLYVAIFPAIIAQICWVRGLELIGSNRGGVFINLVPIFAAGLAVLILGEQFRLYHAAALVLVVAGVWMSQKQAKRA